MYVETIGYFSSPCQAILVHSSLYSDLYDYKFWEEPMLRNTGYYVLVDVCVLSYERLDWWMGWQVPNLCCQRTTGHPEQKYTDLISEQKETHERCQSGCCYRIKPET